MGVPALAKEHLGTPSLVSSGIMSALVGFGGRNSSAHGLWKTNSQGMQCISTGPSVRTYRRIWPQRSHGDAVSSDSTQHTIQEESLVSAQH